MLKNRKKNVKTVAEKVAEIILHPNKSSSEDDSADEATAARVIEYDSDEYELPKAETTEFRKRNVKLLSEQNDKYVGKIVSRKDLESDVSEGEVYFEQSDSEDDAEQNITQNGTESEHSDSENYVTHDEDDKESNVGEDNSESEFDSEDDVEDTDVIGKVNRETEIQKGLCVQNQLHIWERLLELRINFQKLLNKANQLPSPQQLQDLENKNLKYKDIKDTTTKQTAVLLENLLALKHHLKTQFSEAEKFLKPPLKRASPSAGDTSTEPALKQFSQNLGEEFEQFRTYRNDVLIKWDDRTRLLQPGAGNKMNTFHEEYDVIKKIDSTLANKTLLIEKSQQFKNPAQSESTELKMHNPNIYDDTDFYHQQLRELIEYKANTTNSMSEVTKQFLELQKLRQKMKKKVDTRASKGRKLRYIVHNKLINFMAPHENITWPAESIDELSKSLFV